MTAAIDKVSKRDKGGTFRDAPTDDWAPGYSRIVERPVSLAILRAGCLSGAYTVWDQLARDFDLMFDNCRWVEGGGGGGEDREEGGRKDGGGRPARAAETRTNPIHPSTPSPSAISMYNGPDSEFGQMADALQARSARILSFARAGVTDMRPGATPSSMLREQAGRRAREERTAAPERDDASRRDRGERGERIDRRERGERPPRDQRAPPPPRPARRPASFGRGAFRVDMVVAADGLPRGAALPKRRTYPARVTDPTLAAAGGLWRGHNAEGHALPGVLGLMPLYKGAPPADAYATSVARFASRLTGAARDIALSIAAATLPNQGQAAAR